MIEILTTGGTIDKVYFDAKSSFQVGASPLEEILKEANLTVDIHVREVMRKDSLEMTDVDRHLIREAVEKSAAELVVVTHGTDTMVDTGRALAGLSGKTIVLTGAMQPARFRATDALFNVASALTAVQILPEGVYIAMNGQVFDPQTTRKNVAKNCFEGVD